MRYRFLLALASLGLLLVWVSGAVAFTDVPASQPYAAAIDDLSSWGIVAGFPDGLFGPERPVTRQQFAKMIVLTMDLPVTEYDVSPFSDVQTGGYADPFFPDNYIAVCAYRGITKGTSATTFAPGEPMRRAQLVTMVVRALDRILPGTLASPAIDFRGSLPDFTDPIHAAELRKAEADGLLGGLQGFGPSWDPWAAATRGEVAQVLHNALARIRGGGQTGLVTRVVDGDTIHVSTNGITDTVRLLGVDTPETGETFSAEATAALEALLDGKTVTLETDVETRDMYGRLLAYVWVGQTMANEELLRLGLATLYTVPPNARYTERLQAAQDEAQAARVGIWGAAADSPLAVALIHYDAAGNDNNNLNDEYVVFRVLVSGTLLGYSVEDESGKHYDFPDIIFQKDQKLTLHSGSGASTQSDLYWGMSGRAVWNNDGDTVKVLDPEGHVVVSESYSGTSATVTTADVGPTVDVTATGTPCSACRLPG